MRPEFEITRPLNSSMVGLATLVGIMVTSPQSLLSFEALLCFLTGFFISSYSMILNDYYDLESDRISAPHRVLPSGRMRVKDALLLCCLILFLGLIFSSILGLANLLIATIFSFISWLYSSRAKKEGLIGNFLVSLSVAIPYIYGAVSVGRAWDWFVWILSATSLLSCMGREIVKTIPDVEGDEVRGVMSVARIHGPSFTARLGAEFFISAVVSSQLPNVFGLAGLIYFISIIPVDAFFIYLGLKIVRNPGDALKVKKFALFGMLAGLVAFTVGGVFR